MADSLKLEPLWQMIAYKRFWSVFMPEGDAGEKAEVSPEDKAEWLANFLIVWAVNVDAVLADIVDPDKQSPNKPPIPPGDFGLILTSLLLSLDNAADALLAFRKRDHLIQIPAIFLDIANKLLAVSERFDVHPKTLTLSLLAKRLAAASSHLRKGPRQVRIDDRGHVFDLDGARLFQFDPKMVLQGKRQNVAGESHSLKDLTEAEERNGR